MSAESDLSDAADGARSPSDHSLLRAFVEAGAEDAFSELVRRHVGMVHASALRQTGRADLAEEVVQAVFILLARKAATFDPDVLLGGWLFRSVRFAANDLLKAERRRQFRETTAYAMKQHADAVEAATGPGTSGEDLWKQVAPEIDGCLSQLGETDRAAILLRFFEEKSFPEVGQALRLSEEAARKRVNRALEKLQSLLQRRGVTATALGLGGVLTSQAAGTTSLAAVPAGLAPKVAGVALAAQAGATPTSTAAALARSVATRWAWVQAKAWLWSLATAVGLGVVATGWLLTSPGGPWRPGADGAARQDDYRVAGFPEAAPVHAVIADLQAAVLRGDVTAVAARVQFPLQVHSPEGSRWVPDAATLATEFPRIFTPEVRAALAKCPRSALFSSPQGVMVGSGDLWIAPKTKDDPEPRITSINLKSPSR